MARKRRKKKTEEEAIPLPPETKIEEITDKEIVEEEVEEIIEEYKDYVTTLEHEPVPLSEPVEFSSLPKTRKIKYLGSANKFGIKGPVTGQRYRFTTKDRISEVAIEDYEGLLKRVRPARKCCGGKDKRGRTSPEQPYFGPI